MASVLVHRKVNIVSLDPGEAIARFCKPGDIAIVANDEGWWNNFIAVDGSIDGYDQPYKSYLEALWAAKAAAEFGIN